MTDPSNLPTGSLVPSVSYDVPSNSPPRSSTQQTAASLTLAFSHDTSVHRGETRVGNPYTASSFPTRGKHIYPENSSASAVEAHPSPTSKERKMISMVELVKDKIQEMRALLNDDERKMICLKAANHNNMAPRRRYLHQVMGNLYSHDSILSRSSPACSIFCP